MRTTKLLSHALGIQVWRLQRLQNSHVVLPSFTTCPRTPTRPMASSSRDTNASQNTTSNPTPDPSTQPASPEPNTPLPLPSPQTAPDNPTTTLTPNAPAIKLDHLGPLVVNKDGTLSRIANWQSMAEIERQNTLRILGKRNMLRREELERAEKEKGEGKEGDEEGGSKGLRGN